MFTNISRTVTITPIEIAREMAESEDIYAINAFLGALAFGMKAIVERGTTDELSEREKAKKQVMLNMTKGLSEVTRKFGKETEDWIR